MTRSIRAGLLLPLPLLLALALAAWSHGAAQRSAAGRLQAEAALLAAAVDAASDHRGAIDLAVRNAATRLPSDWQATVHDPRGALVARTDGAAPTNIGDGRSLQATVTTAQGWRCAVLMPPGPLFWPYAAALALLAAALAAWCARGGTQPAVATRRDQAAEAAAAEAEAAAAAEATSALTYRRAALERQLACCESRLRLLQGGAARMRRGAALGRLAAAAVHDINNVLGVVANSAYLIRRSTAPPALELPLAALERAVDNGVRLMQQIARFGDPPPSTRQSLDLARRLPDLAETMQFALGKRVVVSATVGPGTQPVQADPGDLELVLTHLALNSRDALPNGGHVWIEARNADPNDSAGLPQRDYVLLSVSDDGAGMSEDAVEHACEPFFSTRNGALGLGLAQARGFCAAAGGTLRLASTAGMGTTVSLLLPAVSARDDNGARAPAASAASAANNDDRLDGRHLLLVEDNEELAAVTAMLLGSYGCIVETARNPGEALALVAAGVRPDVVLSDVVMPGDLDGVALVRRLRESRPELPVVLISGYSSALGGHSEFAVLQKPCSPKQLVDALAEALAR